MQVMLAPLRNQRTRLIFVLAAAAISATLITGCSQAAPTAEPTETSENTSIEPSSSPAPKFISRGTAQQNEEYFRYVLRKAIREGAQVNGVEMVNALSAAGFDRTLMQVSFDETQTSLRADNIFVSVRVNDQCLIGQIVTSDKSVTADVQPAIGPDKTVCLIGQTRPIDW